MNYENEALLIVNARSDPEAFGTLYDRYVDQIYSYIYRQTQDVAIAQDITSATFEKALRNVKQFNWQGVSVAAWFYRIARNETAQYFRTRRPLTERGTDNIETIAAAAHVSLNGASRPTEARIIAGQTKRGLLDALDQLSPADREILTLRFLEQLSSDDVAAILRCSKSNVYVRLHRALQRLRAIVEAGITAEERV